MHEQLYIYGLILVIVVILVYILFLFKRNISIDKISSPLEFSKSVENGYIQLLDLLYNHTNKKEVISEIRNISIYKLDGRYSGGYTKKTDDFDAVSFRIDYFYDLLNFLESRDEVLILNLNQNSVVNEFKSKIKLALGDLSKQVTVINKINSSDDKLLIDKDKILFYQKALAKFNIQMAFLDDGSDSYNIILHHSKNEKKLKKEILKIGFEYQKNLI